MSTLYYFRKLFFLLGLVLISNSSCRKEIDFDQGDNSFTSGAIDPNNPILYEWEAIGFGLLGIQNIESDGQRVYFNNFNNGNNRMYSIDGNGTISPLFDISNSTSWNDVLLIEYEELTQSLYFCRSRSSTLQTIYEFNENGIVQSFDLNSIALAGNRINSLIDLGNEIFVAGRFRLQSVSPSSFSVCFIDKATGDSIPIQGLSSAAEDALYFNNEIYVVGMNVLGASIGMVKWDGSQWQNFAVISGISKISSVGESNGELIVAGDLYPEYTGIYTYDPNTGGFNANNLFRLGSEPTITEIKSYDGKLYAAGTFRFANTSFRSLYELDNGTWRSIGALNKTATDFAICQGYAYAIADGRLYRYPL
jgi:hypothetical protein